MSYELSIFKKIINLKSLIINRNIGQTLVEVVVTIAIITIILVAMMMALTYSLSNTQYAKNKAIATKYAQEAVEWLRTQRDASWSDFYGKASSGSGSNYCVLPNLSLSAGSCTDTQMINNLYKRDVNLVTGSDQVSIKITVSWKQGNRDASVVLDTILTKW